MVDVPVERFARVVTEHPVQAFLGKVLRGAPKLDGLVIVSPFIGSLAGARYELRDLCDYARAASAPVYVITREPEREYHRQGVGLLLEYETVEVRMNRALHAKLYVCRAQESSDSFALFGSGNLTYSGVARNIELGMMVFGRGPGRQLVDELYNWGMELRVSPGTSLVKPRKAARRV